MSSYRTQAVEAELSFPGILQVGAEGPAVQRIQEWLTLARVPKAGAVSVDGDFGPATKAAIVAFQQWAGLEVDGVVGPRTWARLVQPLASITADHGLVAGSWEAAVLEIAGRHLSVHPREVGGQNKGPWVRAYMDGRDGTPWAWCAGFAGFLLRHAQAESGVKGFIGPRTFGCDELASAFQKRGQLLIAPGPTLVESRVDTGDLFFVVNPKNPADRTHVGVVLDVAPGGRTVRTIEGNTNDEGSREGYEVCERTRAVGKLDFALVGDNRAAVA